MAKLARQNSAINFYNADYQRLHVSARMGVVTGGSGMYSLLGGTTELDVNTKYGRPSGAVVKV